MIYPKYYYQRGKESDRDWILVRMRVIPESMKQEVADKYEKLYRTEKDGRKKANTYLHNIAKEYRLSATNKIKKAKTML